MSYKVTCGEGYHRNIACYNEKVKNEGLTVYKPQSEVFIAFVLWHKTNISFPSRGRVNTSRFVWKQQQMEQLETEL